MNKPDFCVNKECIFHKKVIDEKQWWIKFGFYSSKLKGIIQRFKCKKCGKTFSLQTYRLDYYEKKILNYNDIISFSSESMSLSSMSRLLKASVESISNRIEKLARQVLVMHEYLKSHIKLKEDLVADGFESFVKSQYFPNNIHFLGGKNSQYLYFMNYVLIRRKGRMTEYQKNRRFDIYKDVYYPKDAIKTSFSEVADEVYKLTKTNNKHFTLYTDMKKDYKRALGSCISSTNLSHVEISSKKLRNKMNELFTVNYLDRETRKDQANHRRETKCHARNVCACLCRLLIYYFNHNYIKDYRVKNKTYKGVSHAEIAGVPKEAIKRVINSVFIKRVFLSLEKVKSFALELWYKNILTPLKGKKDYVPRYAFM